MQSLKQNMSLKHLENSVRKMASSFSSTMLKTENIVEKRNLYQIGEWSLLYNGNKNKATFSFKEILPNGLKISIANSTGWVRLLNPLGKDLKRGIYSVELSARSLTNKPDSTYKVFVFNTDDNTRFDKHSELILKNGKYKTTLHLGDGLQNYWVGLETLDKNIDLYITHLKVIVEPVGKKLREMAANCTKIDLPLVLTDSKSKEYADIEKHNKEFNDNAKSDELGFILEYACSLRRVEMSDTFVNMIKYITVRSTELTSNQKNILKLQLRNALLLTHDKELIDIIYTHCPEMIFEMDLNTEMFALVTGTASADDIEHVKTPYQSDNLLYDFQNNTELLSQVIRKKMQDQPDILHKKPHIYAIMANIFASSVGREANYLTYINKYLNSQQLPEISSLSFNDDIFLSNLEFTDCPEVKQGPLVSVIMSAFNAESTIVYAVNSILKQTYKNIELLVCDDGSSDDTVGLLKQLESNDPRVKIYRSKGNQGTYNIRNDMISNCEGEFITFQDSDDYSTPIRIQEQVKNLLEKEALLSFTRWLRVRNDGKVVVFFDGLVSRFCVVSAMGHRSVFERLPKFRSSYVAADTEFYENAKKLLGIERITMDNRPLIVGLWSESSLTRQVDLTAENNGFVAPRRRAYADIASRQRLLGPQVITDTMVEDTLKSLNLYRESSGSEPIASNIQKN